MREIKFRGWDGQKMFPAEDLSRAPEYRTWLGYADCTLLQFTGLTDKNGKEIYEGDIVSVLDGEEITGTYEVEYCGANDYPAFDFKGWEGETNGLSEGIGAFEVEVIGNVYESPDRLKTN